MIRIAFFELLLFLAPFAVYALYLYLVKRQRDKTAYWQGAPIFKLFIAGVAMIVIGLIGFATFGGGDTESTYVPAEIRDGKVVPGRFDDED